MFGTIRRHQTWLWAIIITLTIVSFVIFFSPAAKVDLMGGGRKENLGSINGQPVGREDYFSALRDVRLQYFLRRHAWPDRDPSAKQTGYNEQREVYDRLLLLQKITALQIHASDSAVIQYGSDILRSLGGQSGPVPLKTFEQNVLAPGGLTKEDFEQLLRHDLQLQQLVNLVTLSGTLLTPQEAQMLYRQEHEEVVVQVALFQGTNYFSGVAVTPAVVEQYFTNHLSVYRVPPRIQVSYVKFDLTNYWHAGAQAMTNSVTNLTEAVEQVYQRYGSNYAAEAKSPDEIKQKIVHEQILREGMNLAGSNAAAFTDALLNKEPVRADNLSGLAKDWGLTVKVTDPFELDQAPKDLEVPPDFTKIAFSLTAEDPFNQRPILGEDGAYVIALRASLPSHDATLDSVRDRVTRDYQAAEAAKFARVAGESFYATLTNGLGQGTAFTNVCNQAHVKALALPPISRGDRDLPGIEDAVPFARIKDEAFTLKVGEVSPFVPTTDGGFILRVESRPPLDETKMQQELPQFMTMLRQSLQNEGFRRWFGEQERVGLRNTPLARSANPAGAPAPE